MNKHIDLLLKSDPFEFSEKTSSLFINSFQETALAHYNGNAFFKHLWDRAGIHPNDIKTEGDIINSPYIMVNMFKEHEMMSVPPSQIALTLGSSGTSGQRSLQHLDKGSLDRVKDLAFTIHQELGMTSEKKYNYLCFTYDPKVADDLGTAFTDELLTSFTGINEVYYAIQFNETKNDFELNEEGVVKKLSEFASNGHSTRILGFPAFLYKIVKKYNIELSLGPDSWIQTGGGWKNHSDEILTKTEFRYIMSKSLGLPAENIRDLFGMVEHGIPYVDCQKGYMRIPNYARIIIRDPITLAPVTDGEYGLIQFICTYNTSYPSMNLLSTDYGRVVSIDDGAKILEIKGRAGVQKHKGCALKANEMLQEN